MPNKLLDTYLGSKELKKIIIHRSEELEIPFRYICHHLRISYPDFMKQYINSNSANADLTESQFEQILFILGINIRFQFVVEKGYRALDVKEELRTKFENINDARTKQIDKEAGDYPAFDLDY